MDEEQEELSQSGPKAEVGFKNPERSKRRKKENDNKPFAIYAEEWMKEVKSARRFPDWSILWKREVARVSANRRYSSLSIEDKKKWNKKTSARNPQRRKEVLKKWKKKMMQDPVYRAMSSMRTRLSSMVKNANVGGYNGLVGCTRQHLRTHLESQFNKSMTWGNYGTHWHVDHIMPCSAFDQSNPRHVKQCWHWTNLRPLEAKKNLEKSNTITHPQLSLAL